LISQLKYRHLREDGWTLRVDSGTWSRALWLAILAKIQEQVPSPHPQTIKLKLPESQQQSYFLKVYHSASAWSAVKDWFRASKALRFLKQGMALSNAGFLVPPAVAAGEKRQFGKLKGAFVLTAPIEGAPLTIFLKENAGRTDAGLSVIEKRAALKALARQIRRLHDLGFVHGDLVASNIFVCRDAAMNLQFVFMDNDRTRRYPKWLPQSLWKRNLVQLNRLPLSSISLQDRIRFFQEYSAAEAAADLNRPLLRWLEQKTRERRRECDSVDGTISFRQLMRSPTEGS
jgi:Lipopolysaccharide kinase (Kdo/WaaP) family